MEGGWGEPKGAMSWGSGGGSGISAWWREGEVGMGEDGGKGDPKPMG